VTLLLSLLTLFGNSSVDAAMDAMVIAANPWSCGVFVNERGERLDRLQRWAPGDPVCMYLSIDNAYDYAHRVLWTASGNEGCAYGANVDCRGNLTADEVPCLIDVTNKQYQIVSQVWVVCTTLRHCGHYGNDKGFCCHR
jgi:hypothetical protein